MASPSGTSSGSSLLLNSGSEEDLQNLMDQRKRKRMISNRESARRSRLRKQKHLDDLTAQVAQLRKENHQIITTMGVTTQQLVVIEGENSILRAQVAELSHRLQSLNEIITVINAAAAPLSNNNNNNSTYLGYDHHHQEGYSHDAVEDSGDMLVNNIFNHNHWNYLYLNQPIVASADMLQLY